MPSLTATRQRGSTARPRAPNDEFVLFLQGIPAHCRWQELKDLVRQTALHIRQAVVYDDQQGYPTGLGQIIVKNEDEAWRTYHRLSTHGWDGQSLVVTLARTSSPTQPIAGPTKSPPCMFNQGHYASSSPRRLAGNLSMPAYPPLSPGTPAMHASSPTYQSREFVSMIGPPGTTPRPYGHVPGIYTEPPVHQVHSIPASPVPHPSVFDPMAFTVFSYPPSLMQALHEAPLNNILINRANSGNYHYHPKIEHGHGYGYGYIITTMPMQPRNQIYHPHGQQFQNHHFSQHPVSLKDVNPSTNTGEQGPLFHKPSSPETYIQPTPNTEITRTPQPETTEQTVPANPHPNGNCNAGGDEDLGPPGEKRNGPDSNPTLYAKEQIAQQNISGNNGNEPKPKPEIPQSGPRGEEAKAKAKSTYRHPLVVNGSGISKAWG
ncbi:hypothetical protein MAP00_000110 [Monascus purpureus]|nr:hypothetical protein MAP00_000110 [Monascus purpureus]